MEGLVLCGSLDWIQRNGDEPVLPPSSCHKDLWFCVVSGGSYPDEPVTSRHWSKRVSTPQADTWMMQRHLSCHVNTWMVGYGPAAPFLRLCGRSDPISAVHVLEVMLHFLKPDTDYVLILNSVNSCWTYFYYHALFNLINHSDVWIWWKNYHSFQETK